MKYIVISVSILLFTKWILWAMTFVLSGLWYSRKKNKLMRNNSEQLNRSGHEQFKSSIGQRDKCVGGG